MRSITPVQAVQFWVKLAAVAVPAVALLGTWHMSADSGPLGTGVPRFEHATRPRQPEQSRLRPKAGSSEART
ncbi:hypothetical protein ABZ806_10900 [Spirillospora sp. NPDC047418]